ncbi:MAG: VWA domain-containing protein [Myxococcota bacterium]
MLVRVACVPLLLAACGPAFSSHGGDQGGESESEGELGGGDFGDADGDTISDVAEGRRAARDTDGDGAADYLDDDSDGDGIADAVEAGDDDVSTAPRDSDEDGRPDFLDEDSDADGIDDQIEAGDLELATPADDSDGDGTPDYLDDDSDANGVSDATEGDFDADGDGRGAWIDEDNDGDSIDDIVEVGGEPDDPNDTDGDGVLDLDDLDSDGDAIPDLIEGLADPDGDGIGAFIDVDADGDFIADAEEAGDDDLATPPLDSNGDAFPDFFDDDSEGDGIPDAVEAGDADLATPAVDSDGDGIPDYLDSDSDANGIADAIEGADDADLDGIGSFADDDDDGDGIGDVIEIGGDPAAPRDTDGDGTPDYGDADSDGDSIGDLFEGLIDLDGDGVLAYLDGDSDDDGISDADEAGDADPATPPVDTDGDGLFDFLDVDSDADGLADADEAAFGTDPQDPDSDGDGATDLIETVAGTDPTDAGDSPLADGAFIFEVPFEEPPTPASDILEFSTTIVRADVLLLVDTTGSMGGEISNLSSSLASTVVPGLAASVPDIAFGVAQYRDFPTGDFGSGGDQPYDLEHRVMTVSTGAGLASVSAPLSALYASGGADGPESGWEALYQAATGEGIWVGGASVPAFAPATAYPAAPPAGEEIGALGGAGFREGALPIIVQATDAISHNDYSSACGWWGGCFSGWHSQASALAALDSIGAKVVGIASQGGWGDVRGELVGTATSTGALVAPSDFGGACAAGMCCTGLSGAGEWPNGAGECPLVYTVSSSGTGLGSTIVSGITLLTSFVELDISAEAVDAGGDAVDAVAAFIDEIVPVTAALPGCTPGLTVVGGAFIDVEPGTPVCFEIVPKMNTTVPPAAELQLFRATIEVWGDGVTLLDARDVFFLVPGEPGTQG